MYVGIYRLALPIYLTLAPSENNPIRSCLYSHTVRTSLDNDSPDDLGHLGRFVVDTSRRLASSPSHRHLSASLPIPVRPH